MSDHLPECHTSMIPDFENERWFCICAPLRACQQRISKEALQDAKARESNGITWAQAYSAALDAAREAVAKEAERGPLYSVRNSGDAQRGWDAMSRHALAAIDALREEKPPPLSPSVGVPSKPMWPLREEQK